MATQILRDQWRTAILARAARPGLPPSEASLEDRVIEIGCGHGVAATFVFERLGGSPDRDRPLTEDDRPRDDPTVGEAADPDEAVRSVEQLAPDIVLLDLKLGGESEDDGLQLCHGQN